MLFRSKVKYYLSSKNKVKVKLKPRITCKVKVSAAHNTPSTRPEVIPYTAMTKAIATTGDVVRERERRCEIEWERVIYRFIFIDFRSYQNNDLSNNLDEVFNDTLNDNSTDKFNDDLT